MAMCSCSKTGEDSRDSAQKEEQTEKTVEVVTTIDDINKYGNVILSVEPKTMLGLGFEVADVVRVKIGSAEIEIPVGTTYSDVDAGEGICCFKTNSQGKEQVVLAVNNGNFASALKIAEIKTNESGYEYIWKDGYDDNTPVVIFVAKKQGYAEEYALRKVGSARTNKRSDYEELTDEEFANFRAVNTSGMGKDILFRSSSPVNPSIGRNKEADKAVGEHFIKTILNMADSEDSASNFPDYESSVYSKLDVFFLNMGMDFFDEDYRVKLAEGFRYISSHSGPYLIHCKEGKDRTGFAIGILECLMGATVREIKEDYMLTYVNFYKLSSENEQYEKIAESNILTSLSKAFEIQLKDLESADLVVLATDYIKRLGLTESEIDGLKNNLRGNTVI